MKYPSSIIIIRVSYRILGLGGEAICLYMTYLLSISDTLLDPLKQSVTISWVVKDHYIVVIIPMSEQSCPLIIAVTAIIKLPHVNVGYQALFSLPPPPFESLDSML